MASVRCWQCLVIIFNVVSAIAGLVLFGASSFLLYRLVSYHQFIGGNADGPAITLIVVGLLSCVASYVCWRSVFGLSRLHIFFYAIILFAVIIVEITCFIWALVLWENMEMHLKITTDEYFLAATRDKDEYAIAKWDHVQNDFKCCGPGGPGDYRAAHIVPWSCCSSSSGPHSPECGAVYQRGCINPVYDYARQQVLYVALAALAASLLQILGLFLTCCLLAVSGQNNNRSDARESTYHPPEQSSTLLSEASTTCK